MFPDVDVVTRWAGDGLVTGSIHGAIMIALVWLICRRVPGIPAALQAGLWWLAALRLVLAFVPIPALPLPILPAGMSADLSSAFTSRGPEGPPLRSFEGPAPSREGSSLESLTARADTAPTAAPPTERRIDWLTAIIAAWLVVLVVQTIRLVSAFRRMRAVVRRSIPASDESVAIVTELASRIGLARIPAVRVSSEIDAPQVIGVLRPTVLVPASGDAALTDRDREMALCHELTHLRRHDLALGWVPALAERLFFFHPLARLAAREYVTAREAACDAAVVRTLCVQPEAYGRLLLRLGIARAEPAFTASGASSSMSSLRRRLEMLEHTTSAVMSRRLRWSVGLLVVAALLPFQLVANPSAQASAATAAARAADVPLPAPAAATAHEVWVANADGTNARRLIAEPQQTATPEPAQSSEPQETAKPEPDAGRAVVIYSPTEREALEWQRYIAETQASLRLLAQDSGGDLIRELAELTRAANRANARLYAIDPRGLVAGSDVDVPIQDWLSYVRQTQEELAAAEQERRAVETAADAEAAKIRAEVEQMIRRVDQARQAELKQTAEALRLARQDAERADQAQTTVALEQQLAELEQRLETLGRSLEVNRKMLEDALSQLAERLDRMNQSLEEFRQRAPEGAR